VSQYPTGVYRKEKYIEGFRIWLELMGFDRSSRNYGPVRLREFLDWMEGNGVSTISDITGERVKDFFEYLGGRKSKTTGEVLSVATLRNYLTTINRFGRYLRQSGEAGIEVPVKFKGQSKKEIVVLTRVEIQRLYRVTEDTLLGMRDRAMLGVYYGCGLRRSEGAHLEFGDILWDKALLYVRKGKGQKERYIPLVGRVRQDLLEYVQTARPMLLGNTLHESLFVGIHGRAMRSGGLYERFKRLQRKAGIEKKCGLHSLRHSIATHLLAGGMSLDQIAKFLGHSSLESTQIYTHILFQ